MSTPKSRTIIMGEIRARSQRWRAGRGERASDLPDVGSNAGQAARDRLWLIGEVDRLLRIVDETMPAMEMLCRVDDGGSIVPTSDLTALEVAIARSADRLYVSPQGRGYVYVPAPTASKAGAL